LFGHSEVGRSSEVQLVWHPKLDPPAQVYFPKDPNPTLSEVVRPEVQLVDRSSEVQSVCCPELGHPSEVCYRNSKENLNLYPTLPQIVHPFEVEFVVAHPSEVYFPRDSNYPTLPEVYQSEVVRPSEVQLGRLSECQLNLEIER